MPNAIYTRPVATSANGKTYNRYTRVKEGRGFRTASVEGPFFISISLQGKQKWVKLAAKNFEAAKTEAGLGVKAIDAQRAGLTVKEAQQMVDANRVTVAAAIDAYLNNKLDHAGNRRKDEWGPATVADYTFTLAEFLDQLPAAVKFVDQVIPADALQGYANWLKAKSAAPKTLDKKIMAVCFMLKHAGIDTPSAKVQLPRIEEEPAEPYNEADLETLFEGKTVNAMKGDEKGKLAMSEEENLRYTFFLVTACREKEVAHATYDDIVDGKYIVRSKTYKTRDGKSRKFTPKSHERREIPLTVELLARLKDRQKTATSQWIFPNTWGDPEGHFLRKWKKIAYKAGLNCGRCKTEVTEGRHEKEVVTVCCVDFAEGCEAHYLHRIRKTRATFWHNEGLPVRTIQYRLGHKSLETTQKYLGIKDDKVSQAIDNRPMW